MRTSATNMMKSPITCCWVWMQILELIENPADYIVRLPRVHSLCIEFDSLVMFTSCKLAMRIQAPLKTHLDIPMISLLYYYIIHIISHCTIIFCWLSANFWKLNPSSSDYPIHISTILILMFGSSIMFNSNFENNFAWWIPMIPMFGSYPLVNIFKKNYGKSPFPMGTSTN